MALSNTEEILKKRRTLWAELQELVAVEEAINGALKEVEEAAANLKTEKAAIKKRQETAYNEWAIVNEALTKGRS